jgi:hypothetical protein
LFYNGIKISLRPLTSIPKNTFASRKTCSGEILDLVCNCSKTILHLSVLLLSILLVAMILPVPTIIKDTTNSELVLLDTNSRWLESDVVLEPSDYSVIQTSGSYEGYNLFSVYEYDRNYGNYSDVVLIMDMDGNILAQHQLGPQGGAHCPAEFINPTTVLVGSSEGANLWHLENDTLDFLGFGGHHEYEYNPNSNTIFTFSRLFRTIGGVDYLFDTIQEYSMNGTLVWSWDVDDFVSEEWWCPYHDTWHAYRDITHSNTIYYVPDEDIIYYNARNINTFFKLNHTSKEVIWALGEHGDFTLYDLQGRVRNNLFYHAHSVEQVDDNTFILFDNDLHNQSDANNQVSRMVEITIDEETMTANETWYYDAHGTMYSAGWGDADRLPNGNRLGTWGYYSPRATLLEVTSDHEPVWQVNFEYNSAHYLGVYRMERFRKTPTLSSPDDIVSANASYSLSWDAWYNYRNREDLPGNYTLYIDGSPTQSGLFTYRKFWRASNISIETGPLSLGIHNITMDIGNRYGNKASDSVEIKVESFHISRSGRTSIEKGQTSFLPTWSGFTLQEMLYNITLDGLLYEEFNWTGQDIVLDPASIDLGTHTVHFQLFNDSEVVFDDTFLLYVYPHEPPVIVPLQASEIDIIWDSPLMLSWNMSDASPQSWSILVDGVFQNTGLWSDMIYTLDWDLPALLDGLHNVTLVVNDLTDQWAKSETYITINPPPNPFILSGPSDQTINWGSSNASFEWVTYNAETWHLLRNGIELTHGDATSGNVTYAIIDWFTEEWMIGTYNLTLVVTNDGYTASDTFWLDINFNPGDSYADAVVVERSESYLYGNNSIGAPDGLTSLIYEDYQNGYLTLDMGENEEIIDGTGNDFVIYAAGGEYMVSVTNSLSELFTYVGSGVSVKSFDLSTTGLSEVRYVRVTYSTGEDIQLDAIDALNYNTPPSDITHPSLFANKESYRIANGSSILLTWNASDQTPLSYEIYVNSQLVGAEIWGGSNIQYLFEPTNIGRWNVSVVVYDIFGHSAESTIFVEVYNPNNSVLILVGGLAIGITSLAVIVLWLKKK